MATKKKTSKRAASKAQTSTTATSKTVTLIVNGQVVGTHTAADGESIGDRANELAKAHGLKSYSVRCNGVPVMTEDARNKLAGNKTLEVLAKDTRG